LNIDFVLCLDEKDEVMVLMLDLLREIEKPFKEGMSG